MIYLFEDRLGRIDQYLHNKLPEGIEVAPTDVPNDDFNKFEEYIQNTLQNLEGVLFHKGYKETKQGELLKWLKDYCIERGLFFVIFSGGIESANYIPINGTWEGAVNSRIFYQNLDVFMATKDVRLLCFGEKYRLNEYLNCWRDIQIELSQLTVEEIDPKEGIDKSKMENILRRYEGSFPELKEVVVKLIDWIAKSQTAIAVPLFIEQINKGFQPFNNL